MIELSYDGVTLRCAKATDLQPLWCAFSADFEWKNFDAPYYPVSIDSREQFENSFFQRLVQGDSALVVEFETEPIGSVSYYWESEETRWLEVGIVLYAPQHWGKQIGRRALVPWITHLFHTLDIERVGLTTWSGNPRMVRCAKSAGLQIEGVLRKVRYYEGMYYDSVKLGVLRQEWAARYPELFSQHQ